MLQLPEGGGSAGSSLETVLPAASANMYTGVPAVCSAASTATYDSFDPREKGTDHDFNYQPSRFRAAAGQTVLGKHGVRDACLPALHPAGLYQRAPLPRANTSRDLPHQGELIFRPCSVGTSLSEQLFWTSHCPVPLLAGAPNFLFLAFEVTKVTRLFGSSFLRKTTDKMSYGGMTFTMLRRTSRCSWGSSAVAPPVLRGYEEVLNKATSRTACGPAEPRLESGHLSPLHLLG